MRIKRALIKRRRKKKVFQLAKGYYGAKSKLFRQAVETVRKGFVYAYRDRRRKKRDFRRLWITQVNAGSRRTGISYSKFLKGLKDLSISLNRKMLADLAANDEEAFVYLAGLIKEGT